MVTLLLDRTLEQKLESTEIRRSTTAQEPEPATTEEAKTEEMTSGMRDSPPAKIERDDCRNQGRRNEIGKKRRPVTTTERRPSPRAGKNSKNTSSGAGNSGGKRKREE
jgi:hypothetical protein